MHILLVSLRRLLLAASLLCSAQRALAADPAPAQRRLSEVRWAPEWTPVGVVEVGGTVVLTALNMHLFRSMDGPFRPQWRGGVLFDDPVRSLLRARSPSTQRGMARYSDVGLRTLALFPYVVDVGVVALGVHQAPRVALEMALMDAEALTLAGITQLLTSRWLGRERPYVRECRGDGGFASGRCGTSNDNRSFFSGHAVAAFTSAGLTCLHHEYLPLYGGGPVESWACIWAVSLASATGVFRITSDNHYVSDVAVGAALGYLYGYALPKWLHYANLRPRAGAASAGLSELRVGLLPSSTEGLGLQLGGRF